MAANIRRMLDIENLDKNSLKWLPISMAAPWMLRIVENSFKVLPNVQWQRRLWRKNIRWQNGFAENMKI